MAEAGCGWRRRGEASSRRGAVKCAGLGPVRCRRLGPAGLQGAGAVQQQQGCVHQLSRGTKPRGVQPPREGRRDVAAALLGRLLCSLFYILRFLIPFKLSIMADATPSDTQRGCCRQALEVRACELHRRVPQCAARLGSPAGTATVPPHRLAGLSRPGPLARARPGPGTRADRGAAAAGAARGPEQRGRPGRRRWRASPGGAALAHQQQRHGPRGTLAGLLPRLPVSGLVAWLCLLRWAHPYCCERRCALATHPLPPAPAGTWAAPTPSARCAPTTRSASAPAALCPSTSRWACGTVCRQSAWGLDAASACSHPCTPRRRLNEAQLTE